MDEEWMGSDGQCRHGGDGHVLVRMVLDRQARSGEMRSG